MKTYNRYLLASLLPLAALAACSGGDEAAGEAEAQQSGGLDPDVIAQSAAQYIEDGQAPDSIGTGPYPAKKGQYDSLPDFVVYQPADLAGLGNVEMPIYVFGNGACSEDAASSRQHLLEIASHGYLVIAPGGIYSGPDIEMTPESWASHRDKTHYQELGQAIDWAIAENGREGSPFAGKIDTDRVAVSGYSCGGIQALKYAGDPRVSTFVIMNSGILGEDVPNSSGEMAAEKSLLRDITKPIIYVLGGEEDIAYENGMDDYSRLTHVPSAVINIDATHDGTYAEPNGGKAAQAVVAWLEWQLRGSEDAAKWFIGDDCKLCTDPEWTIESRNLS